MRLAADLVGTDRTPPEVAFDDVEAQHLQRWMLLRPGDAEPGEVYVVEGPPQPFTVPADTGRPVRWVNVDTTELEDPVVVTATSRMEIVLGADPNVLQPLLPEDLLTPEEEALARNGLCHEQIEEDLPDGDEDDEDDDPLYCGRLSDPASYYRACTACDQQRQQESAGLEARHYVPTYGPAGAV